MLDVHCHIINEIDDGSRDLETTIEMLKIAERDGNREIIATPHYYRGRYEHQYSEVKKRVEELNKLCLEENINVKIHSGQEIMLDKYTPELYEQGKIGCLMDSKCMLLELDPFELKPYTFDILYELKILGIVPIIAHPERYEFIMKDFNIINKFIEEGCYFQLNAGSIEGKFGKKVQNNAVKFLQYELCDFIGSDAHGIKRRTPELKGVNEMLINSYEKILKEIEINNSNLSKKSIKEKKRKKIEVKKSILERFKSILPNR